MVSNDRKENSFSIAIKFFKNFLNPAKEPKKLYEEIGQQRVKIKELLQEYKLMAEWNIQYSSTLGTLTGAMNALIWKKDAENRYILANENHCRFFFGIDVTPECLAYIKGKTDYEMVKQTYFDQGLTNTVLNLCEESDEYVKKTGEICHFIEVGVLDDTEVLLYVVKVPQYDEHHNFLGTVGMGWNFTNHSEFFVKMLNRWVFDKKALIIYKNQAACCYVIQPEVNRCEIFKHICPNPHYNKECSNDCTDCWNFAIKKENII